MSYKHLTEGAVRVLIIVPCQYLPPGLIGALKWMQCMQDGWASDKS